MYQLILVSLYQHEFHQSYLVCACYLHSGASFSAIAGIEYNQSYFRQLRMVGKAAKSVDFWQFDVWWLAPLLYTQHLSDWDLRKMRCVLLPECELISHYTRLHYESWPEQGGCATNRKCTYHCEDMVYQKPTYRFILFPHLSVIGGAWAEPIQLVEESLIFVHQGSHWSCKWCLSWKSLVSVLKKSWKWLWLVEVASCYSLLNAILVTKRWQKNWNYHIWLNKCACLNKRSPDFWLWSSIIQAILNISQWNFQDLQCSSTIPGADTALQLHQFYVNKCKWNVDLVVGQGD